MPRNNKGSTMELKIGFEIYSKDNCEWCSAAKSIISNKEIKYTEYKLNEDFSRETLSILLGNPDKITLPQIFYNGKLIGGYEDLLVYFEEHGI